jgi:hypothetical protein
MKKVLFLFLLLLVTCGGSNEEIAVQDTTTTLLEDTTTTSLKQITTTIKLTTTTTTTTTLPTTGIGLDENGNEIYPAIQSIKVTKPDISNGEKFSVKRYSQSEIDNYPLDALRGNEIELVLNVVPGTNPIVTILIAFGQINENSYTLAGSCVHSVGFDRKQNIKPIYRPQELILFCGDFNNNRDTSNYSGSVYSLGDVSIVQIYLEDEFGNYTSYYSPFTGYKNVSLKEGFSTSLGETDKSLEEPTEEYIQFFPTEIIFEITR